MYEDFIRDRGQYYILYDQQISYTKNNSTEFKLDG